MDTSPIAGLTPAQLELRKTGLTATDMVALSGFSRWGSPLEVWESKMGAPPKETSRAMRMGNATEAIIADELAETFGVRAWPATTVRDRDVPHYLATPDRFVGLVRPRIRKNMIVKGTEPDAVMECKLVGRHMVGEWLVREGDGDEERVFPASVAVQTCWQMGVTRTPVNYVGALLGGWAPGDEHYMPVPFDTELWGHLRETADRFWRDHVLTGSPPAPDASDRATEALERIYPRAKRQVLVEAPPEAVALMRQYREAHAEMMSAEERKKLAGNLLRAAIGATEAQGLIASEHKATWTEQSGRVDYAALCRAKGIAETEIEKFRGAPSRVLRVAALSKKEQGMRNVGHAA